MAFKPFPIKFNRCVIMTHDHAHCESAIREVMSEYTNVRSSMRFHEAFRLRHNWSSESEPLSLTWSSEAFYRGSENSESTRFITFQDVLDARKKIQEG